MDLTYIDPQAKIPIYFQVIKAIINQCSEVNGLTVMFSSSQTRKTAIGSSVLDSSGRKALKTLHKCQWYKIFRSGAGVQVGSPYHWIPSLSWFSDPIEGTVTAL